jgi:membrane-bound metal-dependent hydrolase YbcI (DUF457 family)
MDPLSHAALGRTLIALRRQDDGQGRRATIAAAILGALAPDVDAVCMPFGWDVYLRVHEAGTHTVGGAIGAGLLTAVVVRAFARSARWTPLAIAGVVTSLSHVLLDLLSSARLRVFWPIVDRQVTLPLVGMADPWLGALLVAPAVVSIWSRRPQRVAAIALTAAAVFLGMKAVLLRQAATAYDANRLVTPPAVARNVEATWASLTEWHVMDRTAEQLRVWRIDARSGGAALLLSWPIVAETPLVAASRSLATVRNFLRVHDLGFAVTLPKAAGGADVFWSDVRYCWNPASAGAPQLEPKVVIGTEAIACALWFGGEFDAHGQPVMQVVKVFGFTQTRSAD